MEQPAIFELRRQILRLETLYDAAISLRRHRDEREIATELVERAVALLDAGRGVCLLTSRDREVAELSFAGSFEHEPEAENLGRSPDLARLLTGTAVLSLEPGRLGGIEHQGAAGLPLRGRSGILGALLLFDRESRGDAAVAFDEEDLRFLSALGALGAVALDSSRQLAHLEAERRQLREENRFLRGHDRSRPLIGEAPELLRALDLARRVASSKVPVLIRGESGTGKELVARILHDESERRDGPLVAVNCSAIPEPLLEAELFGIEKGVATGVDARQGKIQAADGGTLFLDEVGDMPASLQAKLLRVLAESEIERVGGRHKQKINIRVVAATHRDLEGMTEAGEFRRDLYYRLRVVEITLPPLRDRRSDIPLLVRHFLPDDRTVSHAAMTRLMKWGYPGNVRELENIIAGASAVTSLQEISAEDLALLAPHFDGPDQLTGPSAVVETMRDAQLIHARRVLDQAGGNKSLAARRLGIDRKTLSRLLYQKRPVVKNDPLS